MHRKMIAAALVIVLAVVSTACGKGETDKEKYTGKKRGFRVYVTEKVNGVVTSERQLRREYENLGTERTETQYDSEGNVRGLTKEYYDSSGEHLLKKVVWEDGYPTESYEYDLDGRIVREAVKFEHPEDFKSEAALSFPLIYFQLSQKEFLWITGLPSYADTGVTELKTEYTYFDKSDRLKKVTTVSGDGTVLASFEMGEEDIVLSGFVSGVDNRGYEETYDPDTNTGRCVWITYGMDDRNGVKTYDESGRCRSCTFHDLRDNSEQDIQVNYTQDGFFAIINSYSEENEITGKEE
ncbi:MAG: hypothetical protein ILO68_03115, partial [Clostridia bacterium]|nr:hypothetical protein [Clostridia bacterium]